MQTPSKGEQSRERIQIEAIKVFAREGYAAASLQQIGKKVGLKHTAILHHFGSKILLFQACLSKALEQYGIILDRSLTPRDDSLARLSRCFQANITLAKDYPNFVTLIVSMYALATHEPEIKSLYQSILVESRKRYETMVWGAVREGSFRKDLEPALVGEIIHEFIVGAIVNYLSASSRNQEEIGKLEKKWELLLSRFAVNPC
ncbi:MAG: hypothetical protein A2X94_03675 [Bdellovibrionales bacterium GWB1_55_8]|nr:MAG: hypothetical protein A2X94_03675 [Bdellovibrionales bacterium GWB1_55_8]